MVDQLSTAGGWNECPPGTISGMVCRLKARQRLQNVARVSATAAALLVVVTTGLFLTGVPGRFYHRHPGGITCDEARAQLAVAQVERLSGDAANSVEAHLSGCQSCRDWLKATFPHDSHSMRTDDNSGSLPTLHSSQVIEPGVWVPGVALVLR